MANFSQSLMMNGLQTLTFSVPDAAAYVLRAKLSLPTITNGGGVSACVATVTQNASLIYTGVAGATGFELDLTCSAGDAIHVALSSSNTADQGINAIQGVLSISEGQ